MNFMLNSEVLKKTVILAKNFEDLQLYDKQVDIACQRRAYMANQPSGTTMDVWWNIGDGGWGIMLAYLFRKHPVWRDCRIRVFHIVDSLTKQEAEADLGAVSLTIQEWLKHHRLDDFISEVQVINVEFEGGEWTNQASVKVSHAGETLRRTLALSDFTNKSSMSLGAIGTPGAVATMHRSLTRGSAGKVVFSYVRLVRIDLRRTRSYTLQNCAGRVRKSPACSENISRIRVVNEQMVLHSSDAGVVITNLFDVPEGEGSLAYMQLVELFCADLKRVLLIRGNVVDDVIQTS
ncbi:hypothetical protein FOL46_001811 [Perkinsus olseni]|uniref:SLC12A transporter C-terminal domain-containing protein n=1 Tax=Perkinsus olseni TaxID=32597 RepID=A0A7J6MB91_PEROL|nr:hypothetical protein FOL46_001811 [Perkinsus olseni]